LFPRVSGDNPPHNAALSWGRIIFVGRKCGLVSSRQNGLMAPPSVQAREKTYEKACHNEA